MSGTRIDVTELWGRVGWPLAARLTEPRNRQRHDGTFSRSRASKRGLTYDNAVFGWVQGRLIRHADSEAGVFELESRRLLVEPRHIRYVNECRSGRDTQRDRCTVAKPYARARRLFEDLSGWLLGANAHNRHGEACRAQNTASGVYGSAHDVGNLDAQNVWAVLRDNQHDLCTTHSLGALARGLADHGACRLG